MAAAFAAADAAAQSSPLSRSFEAGPPFGGSAQVPSLWYYGPSYSLRYDRRPRGAGQPYRPSLRSDPYYGPDYVDRLERGQRFGPVPAWPYRHDVR
jgi:hypothetical protein